MARTKNTTRAPSPKRNATNAPPRPRASVSGFDAASIGRRTEKWLATPAGINSLLQFTLPLMRDRVRDQARNIPWTKRASRSWVANVIGTGIRPIPTTPDKKFNRAARELWNQFVERCDVAGRLDFYGLQTLAARSFKNSGEVLIRKRYRPTDKYDLPVPLQLQMIEGDQLDHRLTEKLQNGGKIMQGVELDTDDARVAYHIYKEHPQEMLSGFGGTERLVIPAKEIIHIFEPDRPGQQRGYPSMVSSVIRMLDLQEYEDAEIVRQKLGAMLVGFIKSLDSADGGNVLNSQSSGTEADGSAGIPEVTFESGTMQQLDPGQDITWTPTLDPGNNYERFLQWQLRAQAADADVTYEQASGDLRNVSFSSMRAGLNEVHRLQEQVQHNIFVHQFCRNVWEEFINLAVLTGALPLPDDFATNKFKYFSAKWIPQGWPYVSPLDEARAAQIDVRSGVSSRASEVAHRGRDVEDLDAEISADNERADKLGLVFDTDPRQVDVRGQVQQKEPPPPKGDATDDATSSGGGSKRGFGASRGKKQRKAKR